MQKMTRRMVTFGAALGAAGLLAAEQEAEAYRLTEVFNLVMARNPSNQRGLQYVPPATFTELTAYSASADEIYWNHEHPPIVWARMSVVWRPATTAHQFRLLYGPSNALTEIGTITPEPQHINQVSIQRLNVTTQFQAIRAAGVATPIVAKFKGDGVAELELWRAYFDILWDI
jgi:hypothetical protein